MSLGDIVSDKIDATAPGVKAWRRAALITVANCCGTLIAGGVLGFFTIIWTKSNASDTNAHEITEHREKSLARHNAAISDSMERHNTLLGEIAVLKAQATKGFELDSSQEGVVAGALERLETRIDALELEIENFSSPLSLVLPKKEDTPYSIYSDQHRATQQQQQPILIPDDKLPHREVVHQSPPSAIEVMEAKEAIQQRVDKAIYRKDKANR